MIIPSAASRRGLQRPILSASRGSRCYARLDFNHDFGPPEAAFRQRFSVECDVEVLWTEAGDEPISRDTLAAWEDELQEMVRESALLWPGLSGWDREPAPRRPGRNNLNIDVIDVPASKCGS